MEEKVARFEVQRFQGNDMGLAAEVEEFDFGDGLVEEAAAEALRIFRWNRWRNTGRWRGWR